MPSASMQLRPESSRCQVLPRARGFVVAAGVSTLLALSVAQAQKPSRRGPARRGAAAHIAVAAARAPDGRTIFSTTCAVCHQTSGEGVEEKYPPLAGSEWVADDEARLVRIILHGLTGPVDVAGQSYSGAMPPWGGALTDPDIAAVATYVRGAWGNTSAPVTAASVKHIRVATSARKTPWTVPELAQIVTRVKK